ncbi:MAG: hypothetical protein MK226_11515 [Saprospiraceae bacterium]|nr:hypothetical protein [Saprospiraceae bacterium]
MKDTPLKYHEKNKDYKALKEMVAQNPFPISFLLDRVENARNMGAMFRLADAARLECIYCYQMEAIAGGKKLKRVARGTNEHIQKVDFTKVEEVKKLKETHTIYALEITHNSIPHTMLKPKFPCVLLIGNEKHGVSEELLGLADQSVHIPMHGINLSMNVAMATGIAIYKILEHLPIDDD